MKKKIIVEGMSCGHCVNHVKTALEELKGASNVSVDLDSKTALVESSGEIKDADIKSAIEDVGYEVVSIEQV
ncbi:MULTISPECIES: heavy-metal-associated domain-containing protein [Clostridium]|uniref:Copper chaperone CopZ n=3 Tax=Clostridium TaxID=1485 RepID=D8GLX3_CLOLD|nr:MULTISPECIES: cation transporter [Clostridium]ADK15547.1 predicted heavy-metal binding protein [Clostridium ljungdahlii DSM 13528]AGY74785.1 cation transporter [Clostridium autoethanogenum DSM 10061]ALU34964.1 Copper ion binding protein [Clostridium autoethanogenum DSM 10061]OAA85447.1 Copper chaperone CopZ [Clostridium ljungdahlii DSM 13528]OAA93915.1 Copper chaperone CopZ [Clostridium coskatii]